MKEIIITIMAWIVVIIGVICTKIVTGMPLSIGFFVLILLSAALIITPAFFKWREWITNIMK